MNFSPVEDKLFYVDGRTDGQREMTKLIIVFLQFCESV